MKEDTGDGDGVDDDEGGSRKISIINIFNFL
jgi:hypothetical protein